MPPESTLPQPPGGTTRPESLADLVWVFNWQALHGFGGVLAVVLWLLGAGAVLGALGIV